MPVKQFVKPRDGLVVRKPGTMAELPPTGAEVEMTPYWRRRLRDGDIQKARRTSPKKEA